jgi:homoserine O-acetyltransferase/O-succinyltransferase
MTPRELRFQYLESFELESGDSLRNVRQAYFLDGNLNEERDNVVIIFHALTGSANAAGDWWQEVIGPGRAIDTDRYAVLCTNLLGSCYGTTGPSDPERRPFPPVTTRDMARLIHGLATELGIRSVSLAMGGSLGGMIALEWAASYPDLTRATMVFAAPAAHTAAAIGWNHIQRRMIAAAGDAGLEVARMVAMMTYRTAAEFSERFGRTQDDDGTFEVESYLSRHGEKLRERFDVHSYLTLLNAMDSHDVARRRNGVEGALAGVPGRLIGVGIPGDVLYSADDVREWTRLAGAEYFEIHSIRGHDAFLLEPDQVSDLIENALGGADIRQPKTAGALTGRAPLIAGSRPSG